MAVPTIEELFAPLTRDQVLASEIAIAQQLGLPVTAWQPVSIGREILYIDAQMVANFSVTTSAAARGGSLQYATGGWLTLLAWNVYEVERIESSYATGSILLDNSTATPHTFAPGDVRVLNNTNGKTYTNTTGGTLVASGDLSLEFSADEPGTSSNLTSGDTLSLVVAIPGVTAAWEEDLIGQDEETDTALRIRCEESNAKASPNGPADAYNYYAKSTLRPDGTNVGVTRTNVVQANGTVTVYVADADGGLITGDVDLVQANLNANVVPTGFTAITASATTLDITIEMTLTKDPDATASNSDLENLITTAISGYFSSVPVGGDKSLAFGGVYLSTLITLTRVACGANVVDVVIDAPAADVALLPSQVPAINGTITFNWSSS